MKRFCLLLIFVSVFFTCKKSDEVFCISENPCTKAFNLLKNSGYHVEQTQAGESYIPDQFVVRADDSEKLEKMRVEMRTTFGNNFKILKKCGACEESSNRNLGVWELWEVDNIGINERGKSGKKKVASTVGHEEIRENIYLLPDINEEESKEIQLFDSLPLDFEPIPKDEYVPGTGGALINIAILDTGVDYTFQKDLDETERPILAFWHNKFEIGLQGGDDNISDYFCFPDDLIGWDFVNQDNNPQDDNSHGTHIAGIISQTLREKAPKTDFRFMPLKILDKNGIGTSFDAACAIIYAVEKGADIINASWGFYGEEDLLLQKALDYAGEKGVIVMNSCGNDGRDIAEIAHQPTASANRLNSLMVISAMKKNSMEVLEKSNVTVDQRGLNFDFHATFGEDVESLVPKHMEGKVSPFKSGTSIANARSTALLAYLMHFCVRFRGDPNELRTFVEKELIPQNTFERIYELNGKSYKYRTWDWLPIDSCK